MELGLALLTFFLIVVVLMGADALWKRRKESQKAKRRIDTIKDETKKVMEKASVTVATPPPLPKQTRNTTVITSKDTQRTMRGSHANTQYVDDAAYLVSVNNIANLSATPPPLPDEKPSYDGDGGKFGGGGASGTWDTPTPKPSASTSHYTNDHHKHDHYSSPSSYSSPSYSSGSDSGSSSDGGGGSGSCSSSSSCD